MVLMCYISYYLRRPGSVDKIKKHRHNPHGDNELTLAIDFTEPFRFACLRAFWFGDKRHRGVYIVTSQCSLL